MYAIGLSSRGRVEFPKPIVASVPRAGYEFQLAAEVTVFAAWAGFEEDNKGVENKIGQAGMDACRDFGENIA